jgi:DNA-binding NtrC family response regulator
MKRATDKQPARPSVLEDETMRVQEVTQPVGRDRRPSPIGDSGRLGPLIGTSQAMRHVFAQIRRVAPTSSTVLVLGESGTGKELVAETVHQLSRRSGRPMISVNCGAIPANLVESELFGHERGSFTGAERIHRGYFERADGGTLFLDEINEMAYELQVKLLRVLESGTFLRVGGQQPLSVNVRIVAAAKPGLELAAAEGRFRSDLLYRLKVFPIELPPLREREDDIELLARSFVALLNQTEGCEKVLTVSALQRLREHDWPGNVRELKHALEGAFILADGAIESDLLTALPRRSCVRLRAECASAVALQPGVPLSHIERQFVLATLDSTGGDKKRTAQLLEISTKTLYTRLREYRASGHFPGAGNGDLRVAVQNN